MQVFLLISICIFFFIGCTTSSPKPALQVELPSRFSMSTNIHRQEKWWFVYNDKELNALIQEALSSNLSLKAGYERLSQARAVAKKADAPLYPDLTLNLSARTDESALNGSFNDSYTSSIGASYELDIWGRVRASSQASMYELESSKQNLRSAALSISAELSSTWFKLQAQHKQSYLLKKQEKLNIKHLLLTELSFRSGQTKASDVLQQRQSLEAIKAEAILSKNTIKLLEHQLAILLGKSPHTLKYTKNKNLPVFNGIPDTGLPSELLMQRPDVQKAYFKLLAADNSLATAIADQYPRFSISASYNTAARSGNKLFSNWLLNLATNISAPIFDGGLRESEVKRSEAFRNELFYLYANTLLKALQEVEDALSKVQHQQSYLKSLKKQLKLSADSGQQIREQYLHGSTEFISFLNAQVSYQNLQRNQISATSDLINSSISLYRALSTGWKMQKKL